MKQHCYYVDCRKSFRGRRLLDLWKLIWLLGIGTKLQKKKRHVY